jgi:SAM-dependent methyltransferase
LRPIRQGGSKGLLDHLDDTAGTRFDQYGHVVHHGVATKSAPCSARSRISPESKVKLDRQTLAAYESDAAAFAKDWHAQPAPHDLHDIVRRFFIKGGTTADIGCGSGREVAWLNANGFPAQGFDASSGLLAEARARYPDLKFALAELPELRGIAANTYDNLLCETASWCGKRPVDAASNLKKEPRPGGGDRAGPCVR